MTNRSPCVLIALTLLFTLASGALAAERPNFVVIMLDDLGYSDLGCYGGEIQTPNMDGLAKNGLRFTSFYNSARCCPTRASLLTGLYPHQVGLVRNGQSLTRDGVTIAEALQATGYQTAMSGKWHLSQTEPLPSRERQLDWLNHQARPDRPFAPLETYPANRGFQRHFGPIWGVVNYFDPFSLVEGTEPIEDVPDDFYMTDAINDRAVDYIEEMSQTDAPFFLYVAHTAPHWPLHAKPEDIAKYVERYREGWHRLRDERYRRQVEMGLIDEATYPKPPLQGHGADWDRLDEKTRTHMTQLMAVHAAMVDSVDQGVGRIVESLRARGELENTVILVLTDNGASPERYLNPGFDRPSETREGIKIQYEGLFEPGSETTWGYLGSYWASAANTPFRYWKAESYEGGTHTPLIVHWPAGLKTEPGSQTDQTGHVIDILPTCLDLAGADYPQTFAGHAILPVEGKSLAPVLAGQQREGHAQLCFEHEGGKAILADGWKLVQSKENDDWHLYHLAQDRTETTNLAAGHPDRLARMKRQWQAWFDRMLPKTP